MKPLTCLKYPKVKWQVKSNLKQCLFQSSFRFKWPIIQFIFWDDTRNQAVEKCYIVYIALCTVCGYSWTHLDIQYYINSYINNNIVTFCNERKKKNNWVLLYYTVYLFTWLYYINVERVSYFDVTLVSDNINNDISPFLGESSLGL